MNKKYSLLYIFFFLFLISIYSDLANAQEPEIDLRKNKFQLIDDLLKSKNDSDLFNGNILVVDNNQVIYKNSFGFSDASKNTKLDTTYRFGIGSIAKEFSTIGILILVSQNKLSVNDKINKYLPELPDWASQISIQNLLQYTSGLPEIDWKFMMTDQEVIQQLQELDTLVFTPGTNFNYQFINNYLQAVVIERISKKSFENFVFENMFVPAHMENSIARVFPGDNAKRIAKAFDSDGNDTFTVDVIGPDVYTTLDDLYKWSQAIYKGKILPPPLLYKAFDEFHKKGYVQSGMGNSKFKNNELIYHKHHGTTGNYEALIKSDINKNRTIIILTNTKNRNLYEISDRIELILDSVK